jgi:hypothetical protein
MNVYTVLGLTMLRIYTCQYLYLLFITSIELSLFIVNQMFSNVIANLHFVPNFSTCTNMVRTREEKKGRLTAQQLQ